jgi:ribosomal-protein-alanine N-acetyltransferase
MEQPTLITPRLRLRPFVLTDAADVQRLAGDQRVSSPTVAIPYPYPDGAAETWIAGHQPSVQAKTQVTFAITASESGSLLGAVTLLNIAPSHARAELGYRVGFDHEP